MVDQNGNNREQGSLLGQIGFPDANHVFQQLEMDVLVRITLVFEKECNTFDEVCGMCFSAVIDTNHRDARRDLVTRVDSFTTIRSGKNNELLYVHPFASWTGGQDPVTTGVLADIDDGIYNCFDYNASFPRWAAAIADTSDLTIRVANTGAASIPAGLTVDFFADTSATAASSPDFSDYSHLGQLNTTKELLYTFKP